MNHGILYADKPKILLRRVITDSDIPGALAVSTATAAYLDAKYHISKDIREIRATENGLRKLERASKSTNSLT